MLKKIKNPKISVILQIVGFVIIIKLFFLTIGLLAYNTFPFMEASYQGNFHAGNDKKWILPFKTWDAQHYLFLSDNGYDQAAESKRFFPLFPLTISIISQITRNSLISAYLLNTALSICIAYLLYKIVFNIYKKDLLALDSIIYFFAFPTAFYLSLPYSESLMIFVVLLMFYMIEKNRILIALLLSIFIPLIRPTGILVIVPLIFVLIKQKGYSISIGMPTFNKPIKFQLNFMYLGIVAPFIGVILYFIFMAQTKSHPLAGLEGLSSISTWDIRNVVDPGGMIKNLFTSQMAIHGFTNSIMDRIFFIFFIFMLPVIYKKLPAHYFYYSLALGLVPLFGSFTSYSRYLLPIFPIFIVLALYLYQPKRAIFKYTVLFGFITLQSVLFIMHILNYWVA